MKLRVLLVLALCAIMLVAGVACKDESSYGGMTAEEIIQNMQAATLNCSSMHMEGTDIISGIVQEMWGEESAIDAVANVTGDYDSLHLEMYMNMDMDMDMDMGGRTESYTTVMQLYMVDGWMYTGMDMMGEMSWFKMDLTDALYEQQRDSMMWSETLLKDAIEVDVVGEETVNGIACWKLDIQPDWERLFDWAQSEMSDIIGDLPSGLDFEQMFKDVDMTMWVAKDTYYNVRVDMAMTMDIDGVELDVSGTMNYSDFNQPVTIILPAEASEAIDFSGLETQK
jgi:hypothetical protein